MTMEPGQETGIPATAAPQVQLQLQVAALCYRLRRHGKLQMLLVTSRDTGRWILPKGWPIPGLSHAESALREAWEEAGVRPADLGRLVGRYHYDKRLVDGSLLPCVVLIHAIEVRKTENRYPERGQRRRKWLSPGQAALRVDEPDLAQFLRDFGAAARIPAQSPPALAKAPAKASAHPGKAARKLPAVLGA